MLGVSEGKRMCAALEKIWFTIADMIVDLRGKGVVIPHEASVALDGAKVLLNLCKYHPNVAFDVHPSELDTIQGICVTCCGADIVARIECELRGVEDLVIAKAADVSGDEYIMQWQNRIREDWLIVGKIKQALVEKVSIPLSPPSATQLLMRKEATTVDEKTNALEIARLMKTHNVRNIFVKRDEKYVGAVRDIDLVIKVMEQKLDPSAVTAKEIMSPQLPIVDVKTGISEIARLMADTGIRRVMITEKDKIIGSITAGDLLKVISFASQRELESFLDAYLAYALCIYNLPEDFYYTPETTEIAGNTWAKIESDGLVTVGIDDFLQKTAKTIKYIDLPFEGEDVEQMKTFAVVNSLNLVGKISSPLSGKIVAVNTKLLGQPSVINEDPYGDGWLVKIKPSRLDAELKKLVTGAQVPELLKFSIKKYRSYKEGGIIL